MDLIKLNNFKFNKKYGQNFIFDNNLLTAIVNDSGVTKKDEVLEIGPGAGTLTKIIANKAKKVVSYEIDENLKPILKENLKDIENCEVIFKDALKEDIIQIEQNFEDKYLVIANLPYYITTPLIFKFIEQTSRVKSITVMVQKEVAERLVAKPNSKDYGIITVMLDFYGTTKIVRQVDRKMFIPSPNVDSSVVKIELVPNKFDCDSKLFTKIVHSAFSMRRKTILNNLSSGLNLSKEDLTCVLNACDIDPQKRAENLSTMEYVKLTNSLSKKLN